jgi:hypothetical protein
MAGAEMHLQQILHQFTPVKRLLERLGAKSNHPACPYRLGFEQMSVLCGPERSL